MASPQLLDYPSHLFVFVWFPDNRRLAVFIRFVVVLVFVFIAVIVGVSWWHHDADKALSSENALRIARSHV